MTMRERIRQGKLFTDQCEGLPAERARAQRLQAQLNNARVPRSPARQTELLTRIFGRPTHAWVEPPFYFCYGTHITLGRGCYLNVNCCFIDDGEIRVGERVMFGPAVTVATVGHPVAPQLREYMYCAPVTIGDNCWIGANAVLCPGVTIGANTVIGAGSVVTRDIPANVVAAGNPCRVIRPIGPRDQQFYYKDRPITADDLAEERALRGG